MEARCGNSGTEAGSYAHQNLAPFLSLLIPTPTHPRSIGIPQVDVAIQGMTNASFCSPKCTSQVRLSSPPHEDARCQYSTMVCLSKLSLVSPTHARRTSVRTW